MSAIFKGLYRGYGVYWHGADGYGDETNAIGTLADCHARIDRLIISQEQRTQSAFDSADLKGYRNGESARIEYRGAPVFVGTMREARRVVFDLEDKYSAEIAWK